MKKFISILLIFLFSCKKQTITPSSNKVIISSIVTHTSVTIKNNTNNTVDLSNWQLKEVIDYMFPVTHTYTISNRTLSKGASITYSAAELGFTLDILYTRVYLYDSFGNLMYP